MRVICVAGARPNITKGKPVLDTLDGASATSIAAEAVPSTARP